jgi:ABC-type lipoprotein release transport system permease subunit
LDPATLSSPLRERLRTFGTDVTAFDVRSLDDVVDAALTSTRFTGRLMGVFGTAAIGSRRSRSTPVVSLVVTLRGRDLAIPFALGAEPSALLRSVLGDGLGLALFGIAIGVAGALALDRVLQSRVAATAIDPISMGVAVPIVMLATTLGATYLPTRRVAAIDPLRPLKSE